MKHLLKGLSIVKKIITLVYNDIKYAISKVWNDLADIFKNRNINIHFGDFGFNIT
ncbi:hypothetical protein [Clostridium cuniculi]|uniref:hypothetical protein n=1 Tax=Clostridium cuniculi TaxID=2548455 RepID=UPI0018A9AC1A|nr:hypothetical protein [Clostridium cuniculi]